MSESSFDDANAAVRALAEEILSGDTTLLGRTYRYMRQGFTLPEIADREGQATPAQVALYVRVLRALTDGLLPDDPDACRVAAQTAQNWLDSWPLTAEERKTLAERESNLRDRALDPLERNWRAGQRGQVAVELAEAARTVGVHVYTLDQYLRFAFDPVTWHSLFAVGHSGPNPAPPIPQARKENLSFPEDLMLVRVYPSDDPKSASALQNWLHMAGHSDRRPSRIRYAHWQWFSTSVPFLDHVARTLGLQVWTPINLGNDRR